MSEPQAIQACISVIEAECQTWERFLKGAENDEQRTYAQGALDASRQMKTWVKRYSKGTQQHDNHH